MTTSRMVSRAFIRNQDIETSISSARTETTIALGKIRKSCSHHMLTYFLRKDALCPAIFSEFQDSCMRFNCTSFKLVMLCVLSSFDFTDTKKSYYTWEC